MKGCQHVFETLDDGSQLCFECEKKIDPPAPESFWFDSMNFSKRTRTVLKMMASTGKAANFAIRSRDQLVAMLKRGDAPKYRGLGKTIENELMVRCGLIRKQPVCKCCGHPIGQASIEEVSG